MKVSTVSEMRKLDRTAIEQYGMKDELLMENAGEAVYAVILKELGVRDHRFVIVAGVGNNGGDGFVVARKIHSMGGDVKVFVLGDSGRLKNAARLNLDIVSRLPIEVHEIESIEKVKKDVVHCDGIVDAIFGTGLTRDVSGLHSDVIELINRSGKKVWLFFI